MPKEETEIPTLDMSLEGIKKELPAQLPYLNNLDNVAKEFGSRSQFLHSCRISTVPSVQTFVRIAEESPRMSLDDACQKAGMTGDRLIGYVVPAMYLWNAAIGKLLNAINIPTYMKASIELANTAVPETAPDRKMQFQIAGLLGKDGPSVVNNINIQGELDSFESVAAIDITPVNVQSEDNTNTNS